MDCGSICCDAYGVGRHAAAHFQRREAEAQEYFDRALNLNPQSLKSLSILAAQAALNQRDGEYEQHKAQVDSFSPDNPQFLGDIADTFGNNYLFSEAVEFARAAINSDPEYWQGYTLLGSNLIRLDSSR